MEKTRLHSLGVTLEMFRGCCNMFPSYSQHSFVIIAPLPRDTDWQWPVANLLWLLQSAIMRHCLAYYVQESGSSMENSSRAINKPNLGCLSNFRLPLRSMSTNPRYESFQGSLVFIVIIFCVCSRIRNCLTYALANSTATGHYLENIKCCTMFALSSPFPPLVCI